MAYRKETTHNIIIAILVIVGFVVGIYINSYNTTGRITEREYNRKLKNADDTSYMVAEAILTEANVDRDNFSHLYNKAFIAEIKKHTVVVYFYSYDPIDKRHYHFVNIDTGDVDASDFVENYFTPDAFDKGYGTLIEWEFEKVSSTKYSAYLTLDDEVADSIEDYEKMQERELFVDNGLFVARLGQKMPIPVYDSFFVLDTYTRRVGWFYFKTRYNGTDFVACFEVSGWDINTTYEELIDGTNFRVVDITSTKIWVEKID